MQNVRRGRSAGVGHCIWQKSARNWRISRRAARQNGSYGREPPGLTAASRAANIGRDSAAGTAWPTAPRERAPQVAMQAQCGACQRWRPADVRGSAAENDSTANSILPQLRRPFCAAWRMAAAVSACVDHSRARRRSNPQRIAAVRNSLLNTNWGTQILMKEFPPMSKSNV